MQTHSFPRYPPLPPDAPAPSPSHPSDLALRARIANAVWTDVHWLMPPDRRVTITVEGDEIAVTLDPRPADDR